ncbi:kinase-like domain-containing protein [Halenospora varia]|nr:kinase-like domain-containing protein [Halenospora varia]
MRLHTIAEHQREELLSKTWQDFSFPHDFFGKKWEDFDHSQILSLGEWRSTWIIRERATNKPYILQSCEESNWTTYRERLLDLAMKHSSFITPRYQFSRWNRVFICSDIAFSGICLADLIGGTIPMTEKHASSIIKQVLEALRKVAARGLMYKSLKASNIFLSQNGLIQLAGFGPRLAPGPLVGRNYDCEDVGHLTYYMLTGNPRVGLAGEIAPPGKLVVRTNTVNIEVSVDDQFGASFFDFLECCNREESSLESLLKHRFLDGGDPAF